MNTGHLKWILLGILLIITGLSLLGGVGGVFGTIAGILFIINR